jgi:hypothetical protein
MTVVRNHLSRKRVALAGALAAVLGAALVLAVTGTREAASALKLLSGDAWLGNATGTVSHVRGYSGQVDGQAAVANARDPFTVIQRPDGAYVLDLKTGRLSRVGSAGLDVAASRPLAGNFSALQVLTSASSTWILDRSSGVLQQVDPTTLMPDGAQVPLGAPTGTATVDGNGDVWVPIPSKAVVDEVSASDHTISSHPLGQPGDLVVVAATSTGVWGIDPQAGQARSLTDPSMAPLSLAQVPAGATPLVGSSTASDHIALVEDATLVDIDTTHPSVSTTTSPTFAGAVSVVLNGNTAYVLNAAAHQLDAVNLSPLQQGLSVDVPQGSDQLVSKDNLVFVNNPDSPQAVVVNANGEVTPITKYVAGNTSPSPASPLGSAPSPVAAQPAGGPSGPPTAAGAGPALAPTGSGLAPMATAPILPIPAPGGPPGPTAPTVPPPPNPQAPGAPTVTAVSATAGALNVTWSPPASTGSSPVTTYKVSALPQGSGQPGSTSTGGNTTNATVGNLSGGTTYCAQVQAVNAVGAGPLSVNDGSPTVCARTTADTPGQVATPSAAGGAGQITVSWSQPALGPYSTPIAGYALSATPSSGGSAVTKTAAASPATITGLAAGTTYDVRVQAVNQTGNKGPVSPPAAATTDGPPGSFSVTAKAYANELDVSWSGASANNGQSVSYSATLGGSTQTSNPAKFTGLTAGTSYTATVTATSAGGSSKASASGTPWGRTAHLYVCLSTDKGNQWVTSSSNCEAQNGPSKFLHDADFNWATSQPAGSTPLYREYGTTTPGPQYYNSGTQYWYTPAHGPNQQGLQVTYGPGSVVTWVFTSQSAAGPGSTHVCEALVNQVWMGNNTSYYELFSYGSQPSSCVQDFWT